MPMNLKEGDRYVVNHGEGLTTVDFGDYISLVEKESAGMAGMAGRGGLAWVVVVRGSVELIQRMIWWKRMSQMAMRPWRLEGRESNPRQRRQNRRRGGEAVAEEVSHRLEGVGERRNGNKEEKREPQQTLASRHR
ncbi:hypothetical protein BHM03_00013032 [Ensete ventricosum]|uniref:Uncharacterized protein n=1 Tax=Ensete ventricosum TaxID=4639 RepID=A0A445MDS5_ENSVE|nr:hypothetical protein BHM03_00013032 [Ensete ventricosum]